MALFVVVVKGVGVSNSLALLSEVGVVHRFANGEHMASFLGLTTSKQISVEDDSRESRG